MKLFIWIDPYTVRYGESFLCVMAESVEQARSLALVGHYANVKLGEPDKILDKPGAFWREWSE